MPINVPLRPLPGYRQSVPADRSGTEALGRGIERVVGGAADLVNKQVARIDSAVLMDAAAKASAARQGRAKELAEQRGRSAGAYSETAVASYKADLDNIEAELNPRQKLAWERTRKQEELGWSAEVNAHVARESESYAAEAYKAMQENADQDAARFAAAGAMDELAATYKKKAAALAARAAHEGWGDEQVGKETRAEMTGFHAAAVVAILAAGDTAGAREYLKAVSAKEMDISVRERLADRIKKKGVKTMAMHIADGIVTAVNLDAGPWEFNLAGMLEAARNNKTLRGDAEMMDLVIADIRDRNAANEASKDANDGEKLGRLRQGLHDPRNPNRLSIPWASDDFQGMTGDGRARYLAEVEAERDQATAKGRERAERNWWDFMSRPLEDRLGVDVDKAYPNSPKAERDKMRAYQVNTGKPGVGVREFDAAVARKIVEHQISTKKPPGGKDLSDAEKYSRFLANKYYEWKRRAKNEKDEPTEEDIAKMFAEALEERKERSGWWIFSRETRTPAYKAPMEAPPAATEPPAEKTKRITRTDPTTGEVRYWNGTAWVRE